MDQWIDIWLPFLDAHEAGLWLFWILEREVIACPRPAMVVQGKRLHCENGPAVSWPSGARYYFWHGIHVPQWLIEEPERMTPARILAEPNAAVRRAMIERYGQDRFVLEAGARVLDICEEHGAQLLAIDLPDDRDRRLVALKLRCPTTSACYVIRVPPNQQTAKDALAWSFGFDSAKDYVLASES